MRLAIVSTMSGFPWGGSEELWAATALAARDQGLHVEVFLYSWPTIPQRVTRLLERGIRVFRRPMQPRIRQRIGGRFLRLFGRNSGLAGQLYYSKPDLIIISQGSTYDIVGDKQLLDYLELSQLPYVLVCQHNFDQPIPEQMRHYALPCFQGASLVAFVSHRNLQAAKRQLAVDLPNAIVVQNPINLTKCESLSWPYGSVARLASVARYDVRCKGQDLLLEVLGSPQWRQRDWKLSLFGEGRDHSYLSTLSELYSISDKVCFRGHCSNVEQIWAEHELLVLPSRSEGTPLAVVEALIAGRPALVTDVGDSGRWLQEGKSGFIAEAPSTPSIANALERAWAARSDWPEMGQRAHTSTIRKIDQDPGTTFLMRALRAVKSV